MNYGHFNDPAGEYVITNPRTPVRWINYIGTLAFGGFVDQTGGALLCAGDPALNRITKYIPQLPAAHPQGTSLFLRITGKDQAQRELICPFFIPGLESYTDYACRVGLGYQSIISTVNGIRTEVTIFVPRRDPVEIRDIRVTNLRHEEITLELIPYVEYSHFDALKQFTNADWVPQTMVSEPQYEEDGHLILKQYAFMKRESSVNFLTASHQIDSFESDRSRFLGGHEYVAFTEAEALQKEHFSNYAARRGDNIGALLIKPGKLPAGATTRVITQLGQAHPDQITPIVQRYRDAATVDTAFKELEAFWSTYLANFQCETPDKAFDSMVNIHNPRQCYITMNWSRYLSLYQLGLGSRGMGYRDSSQDSMGAVMGAPTEVKALLRKILSVQNPDGSAMHQFYPLTMEATEGDALEEDGKKTYGDDHLWAVLATTAYLKESGDFAFLDEPISFYSKVVPINERETAPVRVHLQRALEYSRTNVGRHGIPLLGFADWNDTVNLKGDAESAFNAHLYGKCLLEMIDLLDFLGDAEQVATLRRHHQEMKDRFNACGWDGEWFIRYWEEDGTPLGSKQNTHARIFANAQSWAVISGFASREEARIALDSVYRILNTPNGIKLSYPGYNRFTPSVGGVSTYPPGAKENGGIFLHSNPWVMIAECLLGNGDRAFEYYNQINPATKNDRIEVYELEPYVYAQNILGDEHPQFGLGRNSWLSGTASWTYQAAVQFILGIRPGYDGLIIDPCLPRGWAGYKAHRTFRGARYSISVQQYATTMEPLDAPSILLNGKPLDNGSIPVMPDGTLNTVEIRVPVRSVALPEPSPEDFEELLLS